MIVSFPGGALFSFSSKSSSGSGFFSLLFLKESFLRSEFGLSLFEVRDGSGMSSGVSSAGSDEELDLDTSVGGQTHGPIFVNRASQNSWTVRDGSFADANELDGTDEQERLAAWRRDHENDAYLQAQGTNDDASATVQLVSEHEMSGGRFVQ